MATTKLIIEDIVEGDGKEVTGRGQSVRVHYTGWLEDGTEFDSSHKRNESFHFPLQVGYVIPGWDQGVAGMKVGGRRRLTIPPHMGYGAAGAGGASRTARGCRLHGTSRVASRPPRSARRVRGSEKWAFSVRQTQG